MNKRILKYTKTSLTIILDRSEVDPYDPGSGTPAIVRKGDYTATFWCARETGELVNDKGQTLVLNEGEIDLLDKVERDVNSYLYGKD